MDLTPYFINLNINTCCVSRLQIVPFDFYVLKISSYKNYDYDYTSYALVLYKNNKIIWSVSKMIEADNELYACYYGLIFGLNEILHMGIKNLHIECNNQELIFQMNLKNICKENKLFKLHCLTFNLSIKYDEIYYIYIKLNKNNDAYNLAYDNVKKHISCYKKKLIYIDDILFEYDI